MAHPSRLLPLPLLLALLMSIAALQQTPLARALKFRYAPVPRGKGASNAQRNPNCFFTTGKRGDSIAGYFLVLEPTGARVDLTLTKILRAGEQHGELGSTGTAQDVLAFPNQSENRFRVEVPDNEYSYYVACFSGGSGSPRLIMFEWSGADEYDVSALRDKSEPVRVGHIEDLEEAVDHLEDRTAQVSGSVYFLKYRLGMMLRDLQRSSATILKMALLKTALFVAIGAWKVVRVQRMFTDAGAGAGAKRQAPSSHAPRSQPSLHRFTSAA